MTANPTRSSSNSSDEIVFRGRRPDQRVEEAFGELSIGPREDITKKDDVRRSDFSEDVRPRISRRWHPTASEESQFQREDPFPGLDMNKGWNRAIHRGKRDYEQTPAHISHNKIAAGFAGYSLRAQGKLLPVRLLPATGNDLHEQSSNAKGDKVWGRAEENADLQRLFHRVFQTRGYVQQPFHNCRSKVLSTPIIRPASSALIPSQKPLKFRSEICQRITAWRKGIPRYPQRTHPQHPKRTGEAGIDYDYCRYIKRFRIRRCPHRGYRVALSDGWRKRMRERAVKGGRWTDGTFRQDRLWAGLHFVLSGQDDEDPLGQVRAHEEPPVYEWKERDYNRRDSKPSMYF
jgi:hypothetical protein